MKNKKTIIILLLITFSLALVEFGFTYAYFTGGGPTVGAENVVETGSLKLKYTDSL